jgi:hypothetical protein
MLYVDILQNRVNKTVTEKFNLQAFRAEPFALVFDFSA